MKRKSLALILAALMTLTAFVVPAGAAYEVSGDWQYTVSNGTAKITGYLGSDQVIIIPSTLDDYLVNSVGDYAFDSKSSLTSVTIPDCVTLIGKYAFRSCTALSVVNFPNSKLDIGEYAFAHCTGLVSLTFPDNVKSIGETAFYNCTSLSEINIGTGMQWIDRLAFGDCSSLARVNIKDLASWCTIKFNDNVGDANPLAANGAGLFLNGKRVTNLVIPDGVTTICPHAFEGCTSITSVTIPESVTSIQDEAFRSLPNLKRVTFSKGLKSIGTFAFEKCVSIPEITLPDGLLSIGSRAFQSCSSLTTVTIPDSLLTIGGYAFGRNDNTFKDGCPLETVNYCGTQEDWSFITIDDGNNILLNVPNMVFEYHIHDFGDWTVTTAATCTETGVETRFCSKCDETETREIPALGHAWGDWTRISSATETQKGVEMRLCKKDPAHSETRLIPALGHDLSHVEAVAATESADGNIEYWKCEVCGKYFADADGAAEIAPESVVVKYEASTVLVGDLNGDGKLNSRDIVAIMRLVLQTNPTITAASDINGDGKLNSRDLVALMRLVLAQS